MSGGGGPQWMSSHPNPGNRTQYITKEADLLKIGAARRHQRIPGGQDRVRVAAPGEIDGRPGARKRRGRRR